MRLRHLPLALWHGTTLQLALALAAGADPREPMADGMTPMGGACCDDSPERVALLVAAGVDPNAPTTGHRTPHQPQGNPPAAALSPALQAWMDELYPSEAAKRLEAGLPAWAAALRQEPRKTRFGRPIHMAVEQSAARAIEALALAGADLEAASPPDKAAGRAEGGSATALARAIERSASHIVLALLRAGANPNGAGPDGLDPGMLAARAADAASLRLLAAHGCDLNAKASPPGAEPARRGWRAAHFLAATRHPHLASAALAALLEAGADPLARDAHGMTAARVAHGRGLPELGSLFAHAELVAKERAELALAAASARPAKTRRARI